MEEKKTTALTPEDILSYDERAEATLNKKLLLVLLRLVLDTVLPTLNDELRDFSNSKECN